MLFNKTKYKDDPSAFMGSAPKSFLVWLEIGVVDMDRAQQFYQNVFDLKIEIRFLFDRKIGIFLKDDQPVNVCILEKEKLDANSCAIKPTFFVDVLFETITRIEKNGGKMTFPATLLRQKNSQGETLIGANLIDNKVGYMAEFMDTEGNAVLLYSHC